MLAPFNLLKRRSSWKGLLRALRLGCSNLYSKSLTCFSSVVNFALHTNRYLTHRIFHFVSFWTLNFIHLPQWLYNSRTTSIARSTHTTVISNRIQPPTYRHHHHYGTVRRPPISPKPHPRHNLQTHKSQHQQRPQNTLKRHLSPRTARLLEANHNPHPQSAACSRSIFARSLVPKSNNRPHAHLHLERRNRLGHS